MATQAAVNETRFQTDDNGVPSVLADVLFVGSSVPVGQNRASIIVNIAGGDTLATLAAKVLAAVDAAAAALGYPAPTIVWGLSIAKLR